MEKLTLELKPHIDYKESITIVGDSCIIFNKISFEKNRYLKPQSKTICCNIMSLIANNFIISYLNKEISKPFNVTIEINNPSIISDEFNAHDPKVMNLAIMAKAKFNTPLEFTFNPIQLKFFMLWVSLNMSYTDDIDHLFWFGKDNPLKDIGNSKMKISATCIKLTLHLLNTENKEIGEMIAKNVKIDNAIYYNEDNKTTIQSNNVIMNDYDINGQKVKMMYPQNKEEGNFIILANSGYKSKKECIINSYTQKISIKNYVYFFRLNTVYSLLGFLQLSVPDYEIIPYKPNNCKGSCKC